MAFVRIVNDESGKSECEPRKQHGKVFFIACFKSLFHSRSPRCKCKTLKINKTVVDLFVDLGYSKQLLVLA